MRGTKRSRDTEVPQALTHCIDPRLTVLHEASGNSTSCSSFVGATPESTALQTPSLTSESASGSDSNNFDVALRNFEETSGAAGISKQAIDYLKVWRDHNRGRLPCKKHMKSLELLTKTPGAALIKWLIEHSSSSDSSSASFHPTPSKKVKSSVVDRLYRARCLDSNSRFRTQRNEASDPGNFQCTNGCGKTFRLKGDWVRHEKSNFEEWGCDLCTEVVTRKSHLQTHIKDQHNSDSKVSLQQRRELFSSTQRPCGFCSNLPNCWSAWLCHIGDHFEGILPGGRKTMSDWLEKGNVQACNVEDQHLAAKQDGTAEADDATFYLDGDPTKDQLPPNTLGGLSISAESAFPSALDWMKKEAHCGQCRFTGFRTSFRVNSRLPHSMITMSLRKDGDIGALSPAMAAMVVSEIRHGCRRYATTSTDNSCSCNQCAVRLELRNPGVQPTPGTVNTGTAGPQDGRLVMLGKYLMEGLDGPWTAFRIRHN